MAANLPEPFNFLPSAAAVPFRLNPGEALFRTNDPSRGCFFLNSGEVQLLRWTPEGAQRVIHIARAGETFAEAALFALHYHCDCVAAGKAAGFLLQKAAVLHMFRDDIGFARALAAQFAHQVQSLRRSLEIHAIRPAGERVMAALGLFENPHTGMLENLPPLKTLAAQIGLSHETLYRSIAGLVRAGRLVRLERGRIQYPATARRIPDTSTT